MVMIRPTTFVLSGMNILLPLRKFEKCLYSGGGDDAVMIALKAITWYAPNLLIFNCFGEKENLNCGDLAALPDCDWEDLPFKYTFDFWNELCRGNNGLKDVCVMCYY